MPPTPDAPIARLDSLVLTTSGADLLIYDKSNHAIHHLNPSSAAIWNFCDGQHGPEAVSRHTGLTEGTVRDHLDRMVDAGLLMESTWTVVPSATSRRRFLKKAAFASAVTMPILVSTTAPTAASSASAICGNGMYACRWNEDCPAFCLCDGIAQVCVPDPFPR